jgi:hypothetical protein
MRNRIRFNLNASDRETLVVLYDVNRSQRSKFLFHTSHGAVRQPDRRAKFAHKPRYPAYMVVMFVRNDDPVYHPGFQAKPGKAKNGLLQGKTAIQQHPGTACLDYKTISL